MAQVPIDAPRFSPAPRISDDLIWQIKRQPYARAQTGFMDNFGSAMRLQRTADNFDSRGNNQRATVRGVTRRMQDAGADLSGLHPQILSRIERGGLLGGPAHEEEQAAFFGAARRLAAEDPETYSDLPQNMEQMRALSLKETGEAYDEYAQEMDNPDGWGRAGQFTGGVVGAMMDPVNIIVSLATLGWGTGGTLLARAGLQAVIGAGAEVVIQPVVQSYHKDLEKDYGWDIALQNVAFAAVGSAAFQIGGETIAGAAKALIRVGRGVDARAAGEATPGGDAVPGGDATTPPTARTGAPVARKTPEEIKASEDEVIDLNNVPDDIDPQLILDWLRMTRSMAEAGAEAGPDGRPAALSVNMPQLDLMQRGVIPRNEAYLAVTVQDQHVLVRSIANSISEAGYEFPVDSVGRLGTEMSFLNRQELTSLTPEEAVKLWESVEADVRNFIEEDVSRILHADAGSFDASDLAEPGGYIRSTRALEETIAPVVQESIDNYRTRRANENPTRTQTQEEGINDAGESELSPPRETYDDLIARYQNKIDAFNRKPPKSTAKARKGTGGTDKTDGAEGAEGADGGDRVEAEVDINRPPEGVPQTESVEVLADTSPVEIARFLTPATASQEAKVRTASAHTKAMKRTHGDEAVETKTATIEEAVAMVETLAGRVNREQPILHAEMLETLKELKRAIRTGEPEQMARLMAYSKERGLLDDLDDAINYDARVRKVFTECGVGGGKG